MQVWNVLHAAWLKYRTQKIAKNSPSAHHRTNCRAISSQLRHVSSRQSEKIVKQQYLLQMSPQYGELRPTSGWDRSAGPVVWGTPANFNGFRVLAALLHGSQVVSVSQTLRPWIEGATYARQGDHHSVFFSSPNLSGRRLDVYHTSTHGVSLVRI